MSQSLTEQLFSQLQGAPLQQVSQQLGIDQSQASNAIGAALPLLMGALGRNAAQPQGAEALFGALQRDHSSGFDLGGLLGSVLGGGGASPQTNGAGILGHVLGDNQDRAAQGVGQAAGLAGPQAKQLMAILAPIVLSFLAQRMMQGGQATPAALSQTLGQEHAQVTEQGLGGGILGAVLDQDGDGQLGLGDLMKLGGGLFGGGR